jgi:general stress protein CsbA
VIVNYVVALLIPFILAAVISRVSLNIWVGAIATLGIMMAVFNGPYQPLPVILLGVVSGFAGTYMGYRWIRGISLTE